MRASRGAGGGAGGFLVPAAFLFGAWLTPSMSTAQVSCSNLAETDQQEKILLDDLKITPSSESARLMAKLQSEVRNFAAAMELRFPVLRLSTVSCPGRSP